MKILPLAQIRELLDLAAATAAIRDGFVAFSQGRVDLGAVGHLAFPDADGDCHIKSAAMAGGDVFAVKVATGFPKNADAGLPTSNGLMMLMDARHGQPLALLQDEGFLTDMRTAIAGAIAAALILPARATTIGIVGTGVQARLQAEVVAWLTHVDRVQLWGRRPHKAQALAASLSAGGLDATATGDLRSLCSTSDVILTTTPARQPLVKAEMIRPGARIVAVGADAPGKQEIATDIVAGMDILVADSRAQCLDHGELGWAHRAGRLKGKEIVELGELIGRSSSIGAEQSVLVDLTGLGVQDLQIAQSIWDRLPAA